MARPRSPAQTAPHSLRSRHETRRTITRERSEPSEFEGQYFDALEAHLKRGTRSRAERAQSVGRHAQALGLETLDLARIHDAAIAELAERAAHGPRLADRAQSFFTAALGPLEMDHDSAKKALAECERLGELLHVEVERRELAEEEATPLRAEIRRLIDEAGAFDRERRSFLQRLMTSQDDERKRISHDLHDALGQTLTGAHIALAQLATDAAASSKELRENVARTRRLVQRSMKTVHRFATELHPAELDDLGLASAVSSLANGLLGTGRGRVRLDVDGDFARLDEQKRTALYRVAQEALTNVRRHARADNVIVSLRRLPQTVVLEVADDGRSFDPSRVRRRRTKRGLGLRCMRERVEMLDGTFKIDARPGEGTTIRAELPLPEQDDG